MKVSGSVIAVLVSLVLALLLAAAPQTQQTTSSGKKVKPPDDDIQVKPRGMLENAAAGGWSCRPKNSCASGAERQLRADLFAGLSYLYERDGDKTTQLVGMKFTVAGERIEVKKDGDSFKWTSNEEPLDKMGYIACGKGTLKCKGDGIPGSWLNKFDGLQVLKEGGENYTSVSSGEVHMMGLP